MSLKHKLYSRERGIQENTTGGVLEPKEQPERWCDLSILNKKWYKKIYNTFLKDPFGYGVKNGLIETRVKAGRPVKRTFFWLRRQGHHWDKRGESGNRVERRS